MYTHPERFYTILLLSSKCQEHKVVPIHLWLSLLEFSYRNDNDLFLNYLQYDIIQSEPIELAEF